MKVLITGASGLVGTRLIQYLFKNKISDINVLSTSPEKFKDGIDLPISTFSWNPMESKIDPAAFDGVEVIINLAGANVATKKWSDKRKKEIYDSRIKGTKLLIDQVTKQNIKLKKFINASAIGFYGECGNQEVDEQSPQGEGFLATLCGDWEAPLRSPDLPFPAVRLRIGVVLSKEGGALHKMLPAFQLGVGGILGNGKHFMSWIHIQDLVRLITHCATTDTTGVLNGVAPYPVTNYQFTKALGKTLRRPTLFPVPAKVLQLGLGEMSRLLLESQRIFPRRTLEQGFEFEYGTIEKALNDLLSKHTQGIHSLHCTQVVDKDINEVFEFFSNEKNLEKLTPEFLNFRVLGKSTDEMQSGTLIDYKLSLHGIPLKWQSEIKDWKPGEKFVDTQIKGPYKFWHHTHKFYPLKDGTLIEDYVQYKLPLGFIGNKLGSFFVKKDLAKIFNFRRYAIKKYM